MGNTVHVSATRAAAKTPPLVCHFQSKGPPHHNLSRTRHATFLKTTGLKTLSLPSETWTVLPTDKSKEKRAMHDIDVVNVNVMWTRITA